METVKTGKEKQLAYSVEYKHFKKAISEEFYLEAISIGYAIIEDRLVAFLHHAGIVTRDKGDLSVNKSVYPYMRRLMKKNDKYTIRIKNLSVKIDLISALLKMSEEEAEEIDREVKAFIQEQTRKKSFAKPGYMKDLYGQLQRINGSDVIAVFDQIAPWSNDRNQLIHALLNKTAITAAEAKKSCAENGGAITRDLDNYLVKPFKKNNRIRKKYNIQ